MITLIQSLSPTTIFICLAGLIIALYLARNAAHNATLCLFRLVYSSLRFASFAARKSAAKLHHRNREVLLELGREQLEKGLEKEFFEISKFVQRDLGGYPHIQQKIQENITRIQDDYANSGEVPQDAPDWIEAVDAVAKLKSSEKTPAISVKVLEQIHCSAKQQHSESLASYRQETAKRHSILKGMTSHWRKLSYSVDDVGVKLKEIVTRSQNIDAHMSKYKDIIAASDSAERSLKASAVTQFIIASLVILVAAGGAFFNFHLIALPMSEMVGSVNRVGGVKVADLAALVIICLEVTAGIFLLESLRITKLFPLISAMDDKIRRTIMVSAAAVLLILACTESALAFMRDQIAADLAALRASLAGAERASHEGSSINQWIPLAANMILGFVLPLALTMVAIPLEYLLQTGRTVFGVLAEMLINTLALLLRILAHASKHLGKIVVNLYDLFIALPLWLESLWKKRTKAIEGGFSDDDYSTPLNPISHKE